MRYLLLLLLLLLISGCATLQSTDTFVACKFADAATTKIALNTGRFVEANPLMRLALGPSNNALPILAFGAPNSGGAGYRLERVRR